jgi:hypothetical protein
MELACVEFELCWVNTPVGVLLWRCHGGRSRMNAHRKVELLRERGMWVRLARRQWTPGSIL